jgi:GTP-binding protein Era
MNHLIGEKVSITSRKPQTTRHKITGILTLDNCQYLFIDTPGFQKKYLTKLNTLLNQSVIESLTDVEVIVWVIEAGIFNQADQEILNLLLKLRNAKVILVINKQDKLKDKLALNSFIQSVTSIYNFVDILAISAKHHTGIEDLLELIKPHLSVGEFLYPEAQLTNKSDKFMASEIIREKLFRYLGEELPYSTMVEIENFKEEDNLITIYANVIVDKENQKAIVIGKKGEKLKKIAMEARLDLEKLFLKKVFLKTFVKVKSGFAESIHFLNEFSN